MVRREQELLVEVAGSCFYTILRSVIESWPNEGIGDIIGKRVKNRFIFVNAYPWLTAVRKPREAYCGNYTARERVISLNKAINKRGGLDFSIVGYFHWHPFFSHLARQSYLSESDRDFFIEEMRLVSRRESIVIVVSVSNRKYKKKQIPGEYVIEYPKSLRAIVKFKDDFRQGYDLFFTAFLLSLKDKRRTLPRVKIRQRQVTVREKGAC